MVLHSNGRLLALPANIRLWWQGLAVTNTNAATIMNTKTKLIITLLIMTNDNTFNNFTYYDFTCIDNTYNNFACNDNTYNDFAYNENTHNI